ncbi:MAG: acetamidase, partial [Steroidobacteraceae bacterium]
MYHMTPSGSEWIKASIMSTRGVGKNRSHDTHNLTEAKQGKYHYTMGPYSDPVLHIKPGDRVAVETRDAFEGKIKKETDKPTQLLEMPFLNP